MNRRTGAPRPSLLSGLLLFVAVVTGCAGRDPSFEGRFEHGAVAADHAIASEAGAEMLRKGGNAVDAAVATSFTLSVVRSESCGLGGGGFMVIHLAAGAPTRGGPVAEPIDAALNYREMAPRAVGPDYFESLDALASTHGAKAIGVPGTVAGLLRALDRFGSLDRATVMAPAIRAAERGFLADKHYVAEVRDAAKDFEKHPKFKTRFAFVWQRYLKEGGVEEGDRIKVPEQAAALRLIAEHGVEAFYDGPIAEAIVEATRRDGGPMTREDLKSFQVAQVEPLRFTLADAWIETHGPPTSPGQFVLSQTFLTMPPPSSGGVAMAEAMGILDCIQPATLIAQQIRNTPGGFLGRHRSRALAIELESHSPQFVHALTEALKHAFADRSRWLGDSAFIDVPVSRLISGRYILDRAATFDTRWTLAPDAYGTTEPGAQHNAARDDRGTSHLCTIDQWGSAVACTETINLGFGSCLAVEKFGFILNDQMDDFTTHRGKANAFGLKQSDRNLPAPGKRPLSSMTPTIVLNSDGQVEIVAGASGGPRIISGTMQSILNVLLFDATAGEAVQWPRIHHQWSPDVLRLESPLFENTELRSRLKALGHKVTPIGSVADVQLIKRDGDRWDAACDPRKGGRPAGH